MGGLTTPKGRLMRDVCGGLAGFCSVDARAMAKSAMPDLAIGRHVRLSCSKPEVLEANITGRIPRQWHRVAMRALESRPCLRPALGAFDRRSRALASADRKPALLYLWASHFTFRLAWNTLLDILFFLFHHARRSQSTIRCSAMCLQPPPPPSTLGKCVLVSL